MMNNVIPKPRLFDVRTNDAVFTLSNGTKLSDESETMGIFDDFNDFLVKAFGYVPFGGGTEKISLSLDSSVENNEGYRLLCEKDSVTVTARSAAGLFYALKTLGQLLLSGKGSLCGFYIEDEPRFSERGFMLDVSRYFYTLDSVKLFIDAMALHKLNRLHLHLTDDQGWRIELESYPLLTIIGSQRAYTNFNRTPHKGFYTKNDLREIVSYAQSKYIHVVPEIDIPGHSVAAIASYPELSCFERTLDVATHSGVKHDILCAGKESTYSFIFKVLDELTELFPYKEIHLGGDEAVKMRWELCPHCQKRIRENGLHSEDELQAYFINRIKDYLKEKGYTTIIWGDASCENFYGSDVAYQSWNNSITPEKLATEINKGRRVIDSCSAAYYLDLPYGNINLKQCYEYEPGLSASPAGIEAALWSEYVPSIEKAGYCAFPRLAAFCESAWTPPKSKDYSLFKEKLPEYFSLLGLYGLPHASLKQAMPGFVRKHGYLIYWRRRMLHWEGLHNLFDDRKVKKSVTKDIQND